MTLNTATKSESIRGLSVLIFIQMLPATLLVPAIRPLFAAHHGGAEGPMHAFMSVNMLGAAIAVPFVGAWIDRVAHPRRLFAALAALDAALLVAICMPLPIGLVLPLRTLEGAAHVGAATVLIAEAATYARDRSTGHTMGVAGAAIIGAVVLGSAVGGMLLRISVLAPFLAGACLAATACLGGLVSAPLARARRSVDRRARVALSLLRERPDLWIPVTAAFVARFTIGCLVVTFALFAHRDHGLSDTAIGGLFALLTFPFALAMYPAARATDRGSTAAFLALGVGAYGIALAALAHAPTAGLPPLMLVSGLASAMIFAGTLCYATRFAGAADKGRAMALVNVAGCTGMLLGPMFAGIASAIGRSAVGPTFGYRLAFYVAAGSLGMWLVVSSRWLIARARTESAPAPREQPAVSHADY